MGSKRSVRRESRWGTKRIRWVWLLLLENVVARRSGCGAGIIGWLLTVPADRLRRRMFEIGPRLVVLFEDEFI